MLATLTWTFFCELSYLMPAFELSLLLLRPPAHLSIILLRLLSFSSKPAKFAMRTNLWLHSRLLLVNVFLDIASSVRVNVENASVELFYKKKSISGWKTFINHIYLPILLNIFEGQCFERRACGYLIVNLPDYADSIWH